MMSSNESLFHSLHHADGAFLLPNAWDAMSARIMESAGALAIGTTSGGIAWALGFPDGQHVTREAMVAAVRRITNVVKTPVTADIEGGYGTGMPDDVFKTVRSVIDAGVVGVNLEDSPGTAGAPLVKVSLQCQRVAAARSASTLSGAHLFLNCRTDTYLLQVGEEGQRKEETIKRAHAYINEGADGIFVPGLTDPGSIREIAAELTVPLNIMAFFGSPDTSEFSALGVRRVSVGSGITQAVAAHIRNVSSDVIRTGTFDSFEGSMSFAETDKLFM